MHAVLAFTLLAAGGSGVAAHSRRRRRNRATTSAEAPRGECRDRRWLPSRLSMEWRTAALVTPWADASSSVEASIELPVAWSVHRHEPSAGYPGLHATVFDETLCPLPCSISAHPRPANVPPPRGTRTATATG